MEGKKRETENSRETGKFKKAGKEEIIGRQAGRLRGVADAPNRFKTVLSRRKNLGEVNARCTRSRGGQIKKLQCDLRGVESRTLRPVGKLKTTRTTN